MYCRRRLHQVGHPDILPSPPPLTHLTSNTGLKTSVKSPQLIPQAVLYDSKFGLKTPPVLWLSTGLRAMDHAIETMYHPDTSELTKMMAMQAAAKLFTY